MVTCNDMLAVRGAIGEVPDCPASLFRENCCRFWICRGLRNATRVACISQATFNDARRILSTDRNLRVILDGLNYPFQPLDSAEKSSGGLPAFRGPGDRSFFTSVQASRARIAKA